MFGSDKSGGGSPYCELTDVVLPSSFTRNHPFALVYSTCPPVSVFGTDPVFLILGTFLGSSLTRIGSPVEEPFSNSWILARGEACRISLTGILKLETAIQ